MPAPSRLPGVMTGAWRVARRAALDPRTVGVLRAGPRAAAFLSRASARTAAAGGDDTIVPVRTTPALAVQVLVDELMIAAFRHPRLLPRPGDFEVAATDLADAAAFIEANGWSADPSAYHEAPPPPDSVVRRLGQVP